MAARRPTICRVCQHLCGVVVEVDDDGRAASLTGDRENPLYKGYSCVKGRASPAQHNSSERLLHSLRRLPDGGFEKIDVERAMDEIAHVLGPLLRDHGPRAIAGYFGTGMVGSTLLVPSATSFFDAIKSSMRFGPESIDQPGKTIAQGLHGMWMAPGNGWIEPDAVLLVGLNPLVSHTGFPYGNPGAWLKRQQARGMRLLVIDPRRTETARRAHMHLQPRPGHDAAILAAIIKIIIDENLHDREFVAQNTSGFDELRAALATLSPYDVAQAADIDIDSLFAAARIFAQARRGYAACGTGPSMAGSSTLIEYLRMNLDTLCGHWMREGDMLSNAGVTLARREQKAQATGPFPSFGDAFGGGPTRVRGLRAMHAGLGSMPTATLADEILLPGEGQVRSLFCCAGNPVLAWPDQRRTIEAFRAIPLLVTLDIVMSATAKMSHYVIASKMHLETAGLTAISDVLPIYGTGIGLDRSYGQYTPAVVDPPSGSQLIEEWEFFYGLAQRLGIGLAMQGLGGLPPYLFDMERKPSSEELLSAYVEGSRIPLDELKRHESGALFPDPEYRVLPQDPGWEAKLSLGDADMMADVRALAEGPGCVADTSGEFPFRLIVRRMRHVYNSIMHHPATGGTAHNPAFMHPSDLAMLGLKSGDTVEIRSAHGSIRGIVEADDGLRRGLLSMAHCFGGAMDEDEDPRGKGSPTSRLLNVDDDFERYSGQPRMSNVPVRIRAAHLSDRLDQPARAFVAASPGVPAG